MTDGAKRWWCPQTGRPCRQASNKTERRTQSGRVNAMETNSAGLVYLVNLGEDWHDEDVVLFSNSSLETNQTHKGRAEQNFVVLLSLLTKLPLAYFLCGNIHKGETKAESDVTSLKHNISKDHKPTKDPSLLPEHKADRFYVTPKINAASSRPRPHFSP